MHMVDFRWPLFTIFQHSQIILYQIIINYVSEKKYEKKWSHTSPPLNYIGILIQRLHLCAKKSLRAL